ncbi:hypothetical protein Q8791_31245 [Nocardiopsis sp. CT-R113]|uniref:Uncharacterized protein n=1 Tax=Nocardiopsis codii TaxID=3065942 RepID=A0ABU7KI58_9ACTN|nr:hypothetical protein [Nocardiopsis sp. CT-R113]MEE2041707.1 hypothetical protein [Nocardiopsis sp. CT-R113]
MPDRLTPARFVALYELGANPDILDLRDTIPDRRRWEWLIEAGLVERCEAADPDYAYRVTEAGLVVLREHLTYLEERDREQLPHRSGNEYGIQRSVPYSRARLDAALARRAQGLAAPPAGPAIPEWRFGQGMQVWSASPPDVLAAVAVLRESGHTPAVFVGGGPEAGGFYVESRAECLYVYHVKEGRSAREDGAWFTAELDGYADALRAGGWHVGSGGSRCVHVRAPGSVSAGGGGLRAAAGSGRPGGRS